MAAVTIRRKKTILLAVLLAVLAFAGAYRFVPLVHDRVDLIAEDLALYSTNDHAESSIGGRLIMWKSALRCSGRTRSSASGPAISSRR